MGKDSKIEWTHHTFNPWWGCHKVSAGCDHCYAEGLAKRFGNDIWGVAASRKFFGEKHWAEPLRWNHEAYLANERRRVFCASMADVFEPRDDLVPQRERLWSLIRATPWLDWLLLTKRPSLIKHLAPTDWVENGFQGNVWLGTSIESQEWVGKRLRHLASLKAAVRFVSCEPLLGQVDLHGWRRGVDWVIAGGESGIGARPAHPDWFRLLRDWCAHGPAFLFKQWGAWAPDGVVMPDSVKEWERGMVRMGKKEAGRLLDGREWNGFPDEAARRYRETRKDAA